jgi:hypothetical protein
MKLTKTLRMFGIVAALLGTAATQSFALPANEVEKVYFSDATYTNDVGDVFRGCDGSVFRQGTTSSYKVTLSTPCNGSTLTEIHCNVYLNGFWYETTCPANICDSSLFGCQ